MVHGCRLRYYSAVRALTLETRASSAAKFLSFGHCVRLLQVQSSFVVSKIPGAGLDLPILSVVASTSSEVGSITAGAPVGCARVGRKRQEMKLEHRRRDTQLHLVTSGMERCCGSQCGLGWC